ncbi:hypothetical protein IPL85_00225 [Candidatus Saccharibacteria bacterium]|nr:MAG: hypothetical protein IPL85_00225 [Candidatus Saccharibacteria bacterium]
MKKTIIAASIATVIAATGVAGLASAATQNGTGSMPRSSLAGAIAKKFNLQESDVQSVVDADRVQMQAQRETEAKEKLTQLVKDGKLTQAQADLINAKRAELQKSREANHASMVSKTDAERKATMDAERTALDKWLADNNIPTDYRYLVLGGWRGHGSHSESGAPRDGQRNGAKLGYGSTSAGSKTTDNQ